MEKLIKTNTNTDWFVACGCGEFCHTEHEDYTAGEKCEAFPVCPGPWVERNGHRARYRREADAIIEASKRWKR